MHADLLIADAFCGPGDVVLDIGGCFGKMTDAYLAAGASHVHIFEPHPLAIKGLSSKYADNPAVTLHQFALGAAEGKAVLRTPEGKPGSSTLNEEFSKRNICYLKVPVTSYSVQERTMDSLDITDATIWKIDVEGYEAEVLKGAVNLLNNNPPKLLQVEIFGAGLNDKGYQHKLRRALQRIFQHSCMAGIDDSGRLALVRPEQAIKCRSSRSSQAAARARTPIFLFAREPFTDLANDAFERRKAKKQNEETETK